MKLALSRRGARRRWDNTVDALNPTIWANEALAVLEENMIIGNLVHRDFEPLIQQFGDTVNTRRIGELEAIRKGTYDNVTVQDVTAANIPVVLNHQPHVSFLIRDGEESKSIESLIDLYMVPAMKGMVRYVDRVLWSQVYRFLANSYGRLGNLTAADVVDRITGVREVMNLNNAPMENRYLGLTTRSETLFLRNGDFTDAGMIGDDGTALREANLGRLYGSNIFTAQNAPSVLSTPTVTGKVNNAAGYATGDTTITVDNFAAAIAAGTWFTVDGDDTPQRVVSTVGAGTPTSITFSPGLKHDVADNADVRIYTPGAVNGAQVKGWVKGITVSGFATAPKVGQMVTFGTAATVYAIIKVVGLTEIWLDRPLDAAIGNGDLVGVGPPGEYNFAFMRSALTLVVRPLATPRQGTGALSSVINLNNLSMRAVITYDGNKQGHLVTLDMLMGTEVLDTDLAAVLLA